MNMIYIYLGILALAVFLFFIFRVIKNVILLSIFTVIAAWLINKFVYPIPITYQDLLFYVFIILVLYLFLEILNLLFNIFDILISLTSLMLAIVLLPFKLIRATFKPLFKKNKKKKAKKGEDEEK